MCELMEALSKWPQTNGWGLILTAAGLLVGAVSVVLSSLIYYWTNQTDAERHSELTDALAVTGEAVRELSAKATLTQADLTAMSREEEGALRRLLATGEVIVRCARPGSGSGQPDMRR